MSQMFPLIDVLGDALHGMFWGFRVRGHRPVQSEAVAPAPRSRAKSQAKSQA